MENPAILFLQIFQYQKKITCETALTSQFVVGHDVGLEVGHGVSHGAGHGFGHGVNHGVNNKVIHEVSLGVGHEVGLLMSCSV